MPGRGLGMARVLANTGVARDTVVLTMAIDLPTQARPGQFAMVHPMRTDCLLARPFSILDHRDGELDILIKVAGKGSASMAVARPGDEMRLFGPLGQSFDAPRLLDGPSIFVAGGVGVVPLHWLARDLHSRGRSTPHCIFGGRTPADLPTAVLTQYEPGWELWVEDGATESLETGRVTHGLQRALEATPGAAVATCGPTPMMKAVAAICEEADAPLWVCLEEQMGCGAGVCRACVIPSASGDRMCTVCKEGPVFAVSDIQFGAAVAS